MTEMIPIELRCPNCQKMRPQGEATPGQRRSWLRDGDPIKGFCPVCSNDWNASPRQGEHCGRVRCVELPLSTSEEGRTPRAGGPDASSMLRTDLVKVLVGAL
jgi:hypothetical protein